MRVTNTEDPYLAMSQCAVTVCRRVPPCLRAHEVHSSACNKIHVMAACDRACLGLEQTSCTSHSQSRALEQSISATHSHTILNVSRSGYSVDPANAFLSTSWHRQRRVQEIRRRRANQATIHRASLLVLITDQGDDCPIHSVQAFLLHYVSAELVHLASVDLKGPPKLGRFRAQLGDGTSLATLDLQASDSESGGGKERRRRACANGPMQAQSRRAHGLVWGFAERPPKVCQAEIQCVCV